MEGIPVALLEAMAVGIPGCFELCIVEYQNWLRPDKPPAGA